jgi:hypothetical protein
MLGFLIAFFWTGFVLCFITKPYVQLHFNRGKYSDLNSRELRRRLMPFRRCPKEDLPKEFPYNKINYVYWASWIFLACTFIALIISWSIKYQTLK